MKSFAAQIAELSDAGYRIAEAQAKVAHDAILLAAYKSGFKKNCTVKGGVVMCELTKDIRRTTMDIDIDFVHCSISVASIRKVVSRWARLTGFDISMILQNRKCPLRDPVRILDSIGKTFSSRRFLRDMASPKSNWLGLPPAKVTLDVLAYLRKVFR